jgi:hypothetical protein
MPVNPPAAHRSETAHSAPNVETTEEIEKFLEKWDEGFLEEQADCLPDHALISLSNKLRNESAGARDLSKLIEPLANRLNQPKWPEHLKTCLHCRNIIDILQDKERPQISINQIFAHAGRQAQEALSTRPQSGWRFLHRFSELNFRKLIPVLATAAVVLFVLLGNQNSTEPSGQSDSVATVAFEKKPEKVRIQTLANKLEALKTSTLSEEERKQLIEDYNRQLDEINELIRRKVIQPEDRGQLASLMAQYQSEITTQMHRQPITQRNAGTAQVKLATNGDTETVAALYTSVGYEIAKKKEDDKHQPKEEIKVDEAIETAAKEIKVESINEGEITVRNVSRNNLAQEREAISKGVYNFASKSNRTVVESGPQTWKIYTAYVPREP